MSTRADIDDKLDSKYRIKNQKGSNMKKDNSEFFEEMFEPMNIEKRVPRRNYNVYPQDVFYLYDESGEVKEYIDLIHTLDTSPEGHIIHLRLASPGGYVDTMIAILHAMMRTEATVICHADSNIASAATLIFLSGHQMMIYPHSTFMFHTMSGGYIGKMQETKSQIKSSHDQFMKLSSEILYPVLSLEEIEAMNNGKDFYFDVDEMNERLKRIEELNKKLLEPEVEEKPTTKRVAKKK